MQDELHSAVGRLVPVSDKEMDVAFSGPAPGSNKFIITVGQPGVRIAFAETNPTGTEVFFRNAVTLHPLDAISLHRVLRKLLKEIEAQFVASKAISAEDTNV
jgi:hypothetical protein